MIGDTDGFTAHVKDIELVSYCMTIDSTIHNSNCIANTILLLIVTIYY